ncbi:hypothetical protein MJO29_007340 [Puccinia striiformis f. sp. tritici]|uniref:Hydrophobin n=3 Tax=Puccinia striiformis TaxID=27350 RepID=A0A0L0VWS5_9BASI|nr:hypothetical protein Pst134EB_014498 [Puccinia striiformis f. sp. tritici]KAI9613232.1 hypothetical protein KEM48_003865 [Puccinia striiformis f. sp. tritici PST-130]KNF03445.1 hypothetical protein PSTG_03385 [Puccinia striiformis f. sp. tritici PST-78]POW10115.1 hypothetical protein PSTT_06348 [Puccinia striiformis]KAI7955941.1 hypothetical protein MJO29_007340 [Puccinia striiformis f. sp. tritici]
MHFPTLLSSIVLMAVACEIASAHKHHDKNTKVVFSCVDSPDEALQYTQAACGRATELEKPSIPSSPPKKFSFVQANQVKNSQTDYNCIGTNMDNNYCCLENAFTFQNHAIEALAKFVNDNCIVIPGN